MLHEEAQPRGNKGRCRPPDRLSATLRDFEANAEGGEVIVSEMGEFRVS